MDVSKTLYYLVIQTWMSTQCTRHTSVITFIDFVTNVQLYHTVLEFQTSYFAVVCAKWLEVILLFVVDIS